MMTRTPVNVRQTVPGKVLGKNQPHTKQHVTAKVTNTKEHYEGN